MPPIAVSLKMHDHITGAFRYEHACPAHATGAGFSDCTSGS
jgi:hypothetical protein